MASVGQAIVAAPWIPLISSRAIPGLHNYPRLKQALEGGVKGARTQVDLTGGGIPDLLEDVITMTLLGAKGKKDIEGRWT
jgi:hypothetical protein